MGNHMACTCSTRASHVPTGIQVLNADTGHISHYPSLSSPSPSLQAGEIMMEHPSHYLCRLADLKIGCRVIPIPADHVLEPDHRYVLLPMHTLHSKISQEDLAFLSLASSLCPVGAKSVPNAHSRSRILPLMSLLSLSSPSPSSSSHDRRAQLGPAEETKVPECPLGIEMKLCRTLLFRSQSFTKGEDLVANGEDLLGKALWMRRTMSWMPKLEPIGESESESERLSNEKGPSRSNSSMACSRMVGCIAWSAPRCSE